MRRLPDSVGNVSDTETTGRLRPPLSAFPPHVPLRLGHELERPRSFRLLPWLRRLQGIKSVHVSDLSPAPRRQPDIDLLIVLTAFLCSCVSGVPRNHKKKTRLISVISENFDLELCKDKERGRKKKLRQVKSIHRLLSHSTDLTL